MATPNYNINYNDKRFGQVNDEKNKALAENDKLYGNMVNESDKYYQAQVDATKQWGETQAQLQQQNTDFAIEKIEQQKEQAHSDYVKEQSGAYTDWQKQSNQYGAKAEQMASQGMTGTGYSESSQVAMYNTYQNRVATARESYTRAVLNYDNAIKDAQLQNNSKLAEIAYQSLQQQLELSIQGFQYKNTLLLEQANRKQEIENTYYGRYQDVLAQMNHENSIAEQIRQHNESMAFQKQEADREQKRWEQEFALQKQKSSGSGSSGSSGGSGGKVKKNNNKKVEKKNSGSAKVIKQTGTEIKKSTANNTGKKANNKKKDNSYISVKKKLNNIKTTKANSVKNRTNVANWKF